MDEDFCTDKCDSNMKGRMMGEIISECGVINFGVRERIGRPTVQAKESWRRSSCELRKGIKRLRAALQEDLSKGEIKILPWETHKKIIWFGRADCPARKRNEGTKAKQLLKEKPGDVLAVYQKELENHFKQTYSDATRGGKVKQLPRLKRHLLQLLGFTPP